MYIVHVTNTAHSKNGPAGHTAVYMLQITALHNTHLLVILYECIQTYTLSSYPLRSSYLY